MGYESYAIGVLPARGALNSRERRFPARADLRFGRVPFGVGTEGELRDKVAAIAALTQEKVEATLDDDLSDGDGQLRSFLLQCLAIKPAQRSSARTLKDGGYIGGNAATHDQRGQPNVLSKIDGIVLKLDDQSKKLEGIQEDVAEIKVGLRRGPSAIAPLHSPLYGESL
jgi:hypothetical protein